MQEQWQIHQIKHFYIHVHTKQKVYIILHISLKKEHLVTWNQSGRQVYHDTFIDKKLDTFEILCLCFISLFLCGELTKQIGKKFFKHSSYNSFYWHWAFFL